MPTAILETRPTDDDTTQGFQHGLWTKEINVRDFIQQNYDALDDANKRLAALKQKFAERYSLAIVGVDDEGNFHQLASKKQEADKTGQK